MTSPESRDQAKPPPLDLSHHWSRVTKARDASSIKAFYKFFQIPNVGNLAGGMPNDRLFPFDTLEAQVANPDRFEPTLAAHGGGAKQQSASSTLAPSHLTVPKTLNEADLTRRVDVSTALQYGTAAGYPPLLSTVRQFTRENLHPNVPYRGGPEVVLTCGSTDGFAKTVELLVDTWDEARDPLTERPAMLCEAYVYSNVLAQAGPKGVQAVPVQVDKEGMLVSGPGGLEDVLTHWDFSKGKLPKFIYTVTIGQNPTGGVLSVQRRRDIYNLCQKFDLLIVEDDPYWFLQYPSASKEESQHVTAHESDVEQTKSSGYEFLDSLVPSYLSLDVDGRVIRLDTFSKSIAPGCRLGWLTAQPAFIERYERITESTTQQPSGFVQSMVAEMILGPGQRDVVERFNKLSYKEKQTFSGWKMDGWVRWLEGLRGVYERRVMRMCSIIDEGVFQLKQSTPINDADQDWGVISKTRILSYDRPGGGMFVWVKVLFENHPLWQAKGTAKLPVIDGPALAMALLIFLTHKPWLVVTAPGTMFAATPQIAAETAWAYVRLCFAAEKEENVGPSSQRFVDGIQKFWRIKSVAEIEDLVSEMPATGKTATGSVSGVQPYPVCI